MPRTLRVTLALTFACLVAVAAALPAAAAIEPCSCEYCLENIDAKCKPPGGGVASCAALIRSGACLLTTAAAPDAGVETDAETGEALDLDRLVEPTSEPAMTPATSGFPTSPTSGIRISRTSTTPRVFPIRIAA